MSYLSAAPHVKNNQRRTVGIAFAVLIHVGLVVAISSGLTVRDLFHEPPPLIARVIELPKNNPSPITPIDEPVSIKETTVVKPVLPTVPILVTEAATETSVPPPVQKAGATTTRAQEAQITAPRVDPRHPLTEPNYPPTSRRMGEEGSVELMLYVLSDGRIGEVRISRSSGFARLDEAALQHALHAWRLLPQQVDGSAVAAWHKVAVTFRLKK